jgi:hypothetical protein
MSAAGPAVLSKKNWIAAQEHRRNDGNEEWTVVYVSSE